MEIFGYFFLAVIAITVVIAFLTKKPFLTCLGIMFMLAAVVIVIWSGVIDNGSRRGMEGLVLAIMWGMAAGSFIVGFILCTIGVSQSRKKDQAGESVITTKEQCCPKIEKH